MEIFKSILLGVIQGLTEFLPISSSGHLVIVQKLMGFKSSQLTLNVFLHFGTLIPVIIIFWQDIRRLLTFKKDRRHLTWLIFIGAIPTGLIGIFFEDFFVQLFSSTLITGFMLIITGLLLYLAERLSNTSKNIADFKYHNAIIVGIAQGLAIIPGISRSGSTIVGSLLQGLNREEAARYSFLLSVPVIFGAGLLQTKETLTTGLTGISWNSIIAGTFAAAIAGYFAIKYLLHILRTGSLIIFSYYCWTIGLLVIITAGLF